MSRALSLAVAFAFLSATAIWLNPVGAAGASGPCGQALNTQACSRSGSISVDGEGRSQSQGSSGADPVPVGSTQVVGCGAGAAAELAAIGDPNAAGDAASCATAADQGAENLGPGREATGMAVQVRKQADGTWSFAGDVCTAVTRPQVTAAMVREEVLRLIPSAQVGLAPHDTTLINIETLMWIDAPQTQNLAPITILGQHVTIHLTLDHVDWHFGDSHTDTTTTPGRPYNQNTDPCHARTCPDYYGHTYTTPGTATITATANWHARFTVNNGNPTDIPGTVTGPTAHTTIAVKTARAVLVPNPDGH